MSNKQFPCLSFNDDQNQIEILKGTLGSIKYEDIKKVSVVNEDANFRGKSQPFSHQVLGGTSFFTFFGGPDLYVGLKIVLKDGSYKAVYISDRKTGFNTDIYNEDKEEADKIKRMIDRRIEE